MAVVEVGLLTMVSTSKTALSKKPAIRHIVQTIGPFLSHDQYFILTACGHWIWATPNSKHPYLLCRECSKSKGKGFLSSALVKPIKDLGL